MGREHEEAYVTLTTNDTYAVGALVLANSLRLTGTARRIVCLLSQGVNPLYRSALSRCFDELVDVCVATNDVMLPRVPRGRPDLCAKLTKLQGWKLDHYRKCVFLDADALVVRNCDELFDRGELSACPDPGWPDFFNAGVFVYVPSKATYAAMMEFANTKEDFAEGDQGLLNAYFSDWSWSSLSRHLPFIYNVIPQSFYSYQPALRRYSSDVKIFHFSGPTKPWCRGVDATTGHIFGYKQPGSDDTTAFLQQWWDVLMNHVLPLFERPEEASGEAKAQQVRPDRPCFTKHQALHSQHEPCSWHQPREQHQLCSLHEPHAVHSAQHEAQAPNAVHAAARPENEHDAQPAGSEWSKLGQSEPLSETEHPKMATPHERGLGEPSGDELAQRHPASNPGKASEESGEPWALRKGEHEGCQRPSDPPDQAPPSQGAFAAPTASAVEPAVTKHLGEKAIHDNVLAVTPCETRGSDKASDSLVVVGTQQPYQVHQNGSSEEYEKEELRDFADGTSPKLPRRLTMEERRTAWEDYSMDYTGSDGFDFVLQALDEKLYIFTKRKQPSTIQSSPSEEEGQPKLSSPVVEPGAELCLCARQSTCDEHRASWEDGRIDYNGVDRFDNILKQLNMRLTDVPLPEVRPACHDRSTGTLSDDGTASRGTSTILEPVAINAEMPTVQYSHVPVTSADKAIQSQPSTFVASCALDGSLPEVVITSLASGSLPEVIITDSAAVPAKVTVKVPETPAGSLPEIFITRSEASSGCLVEVSEINQETSTLPPEVDIVSPEMLPKPGVTALELLPAETIPEVDAATRLETLTGSLPESKMIGREEEALPTVMTSSVDTLTELLQESGIATCHTSVGPLPRRSESLGKNTLPDVLVADSGKGTSDDENVTRHGTSTEMLPDAVTHSGTTEESSAVTVAISLGADMILGRGSVNPGTAIGLPCEVVATRLDTARHLLPESEFATSGRPTPHDIDIIISGAATDLSQSLTTAGLHAHTSALSEAARPVDTDFLSPEIACDLSHETMATAFTGTTSASLGDVSVMCPETSVVPEAINPDMEPAFLEEVITSTSTQPESVVTTHEREVLKDIEITGPVLVTSEMEPFTDIDTVRSETAAELLSEVTPAHLNASITSAVEVLFTAAKTQPLSQVGSHGVLTDSYEGVVPCTGMLSRVRSGEMKSSPDVDNISLAEAAEHEVTITAADKACLLPDDVPTVPVAAMGLASDTWLGSDVPIVLPSFDGMNHETSISLPETAITGSDPLPGLMHEVAIGSDVSFGPLPEVLIAHPETSLQPVSQVSCLDLAPSLMLDLTTCTTSVFYAATNGYHTSTVPLSHAVDTTTMDISQERGFPAATAGVVSRLDLTPKLMFDLTTQTTFQSYSGNSPRVLTESVCRVAGTDQDVPVAHVVTAASSDTSMAATPEGVVSYLDLIPELMLDLTTHSTFTSYSGSSYRMSAESIPRVAGTSQDISSGLEAIATASGMFVSTTPGDMVSRVDLVPRMMPDLTTQTVSLTQAANMTSTSRTS